MPRLRVKAELQKTAKYTEIHMEELFYLPKDLYFFLSSPEIYTAPPHSTSQSSRRGDGTLTGLVPPPACDWAAKGEAADR